MTSDSDNPSEPVIGFEPAPDHGEGFWSDLDASMRDATTELEMTQQLPQTSGPLSRSSVDAAISARPAGEAGSDSDRRYWPLLAAAALLAIVGLAALAVRANDPGAQVTTAVAVDPESATALPQAPAGSGTDAASTEEPITALQAPDASDAASDSTPTARPTIVPRTFALAPGTFPRVQYPPLDGVLPDDALFLGTWEARRLSWYAVTDSGGECTDRRYGQIFKVNESGITQPIRDPQLAFDGAVSHFTLDSAGRQLAWLVSCDTQLEVYTSLLEPEGTIVNPRLLWFGEGVVEGALLLWDDQSLSLNTVAPGGDAFFVDFDLGGGRVAGSGAIDVSRAPEGLWPFPLAASSDGSYSYWKSAVKNTVNDCGDQVNGLWVRDPSNRWTEAVADETIAVFDVAAVALEQEFSQVAFADACGGVDGRLFVGTQLADGRLGGLREVDLSPFVPGYADMLFWFEPTTLRVETDNQGFGFGPKRFDYQLNQGRDTGIMLQLD